MTAPSAQLPPEPPAIAALRAQARALRAQLEAFEASVDALAAGIQASMARVAQQARRDPNTPSGTPPVFGAPASSAIGASSAAVEAAALDRITSTPSSEDS
jgi:hypothetical protein